MGVVDERSIVQTKNFCILLIVANALLAFLGRGVLGLIQGLVGILAGIEGYYGAMACSIRNIKVLITYIVVSSLFCIFMGVYAQSTIDSYCNLDKKTEIEKCEKVVSTWTGLY